MSKADYYTHHLFISTLSHTVQDPSTANTVDPSYPPTILPGITKPISESPKTTMYSHSTSELPPPATAASQNSSDPRPNWLRAHLSSRQKAPDAEGHIQRDEAPPEPDDDSGINWIFESIEGPEANGKLMRDDEPKDEDNHHILQAKNQAADVAFLNELKGEDRVMLDVSNLYIFLLRDGMFSLSPLFFRVSESTRLLIPRYGDYDLQEGEGRQSIRRTALATTAKRSHAHETVKRPFSTPARNFGLW